MDVQQLLANLAAGVYDDEAADAAAAQALAEREPPPMPDSEQWVPGPPDGRYLDLVERLWALGIDGHKPASVAAHMRGEAKPPEMLVEEWLVKGVLHWLYSEAEAGKTWLALWWASALIHAGHVVLWLDEELGEAEIARRLLALGAMPEQVESNLVYYPFPAYTMKTHDLLEWDATLRFIRPSLVVFDTATDMLTNAGLDGNDAGEVTSWVAAYPQRCTARGIATLVLDHVPKNLENNRFAFGSQAKRAKAKVQFHVGSERGYDPDTIGRIKVTRTKNTLGAPLGDRVRRFDLGGDGAGNFTISPAFDSSTDGDSADIDLKRRIVARLREAADPISTAQLTKLVPGTDAKIVRAAKEMADGDLWPITSTPGARNAVYWSYTPHVDDEVAAAEEVIDD